MKTYYWVPLQAVLHKEIIRFLRTWPQSFLPSVITMSLYFIIFGKLIGTQLKAIHGYQYMQYIVPGLVMMSVMTNAYANTSFSFFTAKFSRSIEEMLVSSMPHYMIVIGYALAGTCRGLIVGVFGLLIAFLFTHLPLFHPVLIFFMAVLSALLFSLAGLINAIFAKRFDDVTFVPTFILTPLTYLGGIFYSIKQLPHLWQNISILNPLLYMIDTFRFAMLNISDVSVYFGFFLTLSLVVVLMVIALLLLQKGVGLRT